MIDLTLEEFKESLSRGVIRWDESRQRFKAYREPSTRLTGGKRRPIRGYGKTEMEAAANLDKAITRRWRDYTGDNPKLTVADLLPLWLDSYPPSGKGSLRPNSKNGYRRRIETHIIPHIGKTPVQQLTRERAARLFTHTLIDIGDTARFNTLKSVKTMFNRLIANGVINANPFEHITTEKPKFESHTLAEKHIEKWANLAIQLLHWLSDPEESGEYHEDFGWVMFSFIGLRAGENLGLSWSQVTGLGRNGRAKVRIDRQLQYVVGVGNTLVDYTKTDDVRVIHLPERWRKVLLAQKEKNYASAGTMFDDLIWKRSDGKLLTLNRYQARWKKILEAWWSRGAKKRTWDELDDSQKWTPHANRYLTASIMFASGQDLEYVRSLLGHSDVVMTRWYSQLMEGNLRASLEGYSDALDPETWKKIRPDLKRNRK